MSSLLELCYRDVSEVAELGSPMRDQNEPQHGLSLATFSRYDARLGLAETFPCLSTDRGTHNHKKEPVSRSNNAGVTTATKARKHIVTCTFEPYEAEDDDDDGLRGR